MSRARIIKPGFFENEVLAAREPLTRLLFIGLWTLADREGRLEDRPRRIQAQILPYDAIGIGVDTMLDQLAEDGFIDRYNVDGQAYIQILAFGRHQRPHSREVASIIPAPLGWNAGDPVDDEPDDQGEAEAQPRLNSDGDARSPRPTCGSGSSTLDPLTLNPSPDPDPDPDTFTDHPSTPPALVSGGGGGLEKKVKDLASYFEDATGKTATAAIREELAVEVERVDEATIRDAIREAGIRSPKSPWRYVIGILNRTAPVPADYDPMPTGEQWARALASNEAAS